MDLLPSARKIIILKCHKIATKIVNSIRAATLHHHLFKALFENSEPDLILYNEVRWLSNGKVRSNLIEEIKNYLNTKKNKILLN